LTKPVSAIAPATPTYLAKSSSFSTTVKAQTTVMVVPVPEMEYYNSLSAAGKSVPNSPASLVKPVESSSTSVKSSSTPVKPVEFSSTSVKAVAESSYPAKPVVQSYVPVQSSVPAKGAVAGSGTGSPAHSKTSSGPIVQYTGAASRANICVGAIVGLVGLAFVM